MAIAGYKLRLNGGVYTDSVTNVGIPTPLEHLYTGLTPNTEYFVEVQAYDGAGNHSAWSDPVSHTTPDIPTVPGDVTTLAHHYRAKSIAGVANGDPLGSWEDLEGSADATSTLTARPTFYTNTGNPYVEFDGVNDFLGATHTNFDTSTDFAYIIVAEVVSNPVDYTRLFAHNSGAGLDMFTVVGDVYALVNGTGPLNSIPARPTGFMAIYLERDGADGILRVNGTGATLAINPQATGTAFALGSNAAGAENGNIRIKEFCSFSDKLPGSHFTAMAAYILSEHGLTL